MTQPLTTDRVADLRAAYVAELAGGGLPPALRADLDALRAAGLQFTIQRATLPPPPPPPAREISADEVGGLDARDPRRTLHQYQRAYSLLGRPVPAEIVGNLRAAMRDEKARQRLFNP